MVLLSFWRKSFDYLALSPKKKSEEPPINNDISFDIPQKNWCHYPRLDDRVQCLQRKKNTGVLEFRVTSTQNNVEAETNPSKKKVCHHNSYHFFASVSFEVFLKVIIFWNWEILVSENFWGGHKYDRHTYIQKLITELQLTKKNHHLHWIFNLKLIICVHKLVFR